MQPLPHLVGLRHVPAEAVLRLLDRAASLRARVHQGEARLDLLVGRTVALVFMEPSTRTRFSFEMAARRLGAEVLAFSAASSSTSKGETLLDTVKTLKAVGAEAVVLRHKSVGAPHQLARNLGIPILNAGDGTNEHPTQALLDLLTLRDHLGELDGRTIAIVGDVMHSRVARSNCFALKRLGARVLVAGPGTLCPDSMEALGVDVRHTIDEADAVMMLRIQRERIGPSVLASEEEYRLLYGLDTARLARLKPHAVVMHPGPMNRGVEITDAVADAGSRSVIFEQKANGVFVRMAALLEVLP